MNRMVTEEAIRSTLQRITPDELMVQKVVDELFPEPAPKVGEIIQVWDSVYHGHKVWLSFVTFNIKGEAVVTTHDGKKKEYDTYRRQTPAERGEG